MKGEVHGEAARHALRDALGRGSEREGHSLDQENLAGFYDGQPPEVIKGEVMAAVVGDQAQQLSGQGPHAGRDELLRRSVDEIVPEPERIGEGDHPMRDQVRKEATSSRSSS